jgi:two-component system, NtrC family, nitrogen regulation sensor histidine kinase NtrY
MPIKSFVKCINSGRWLFLAMTVFLILALFLSRKYEDNTYGPEDTILFTKVLHKKEALAESILQRIHDKLQNTDKVSAYAAIINNLVDYLNEEEIQFYIYDRDSLVLWTSNSVAVPEKPEEISEKSFLKIKNSWYVKKSFSFDSYFVYGFIRIKDEYPYNNRILKESFQSGFHLTPDVEIESPGDTAMNPVYNRDGEFLFSLNYEKSFKENTGFKSLSLIFYFLVFFTFLAFLRKFVQNAPLKLKNYAFLLITIMLLAVYLFLHHLRIPSIIYDLELFLPGMFARSLMLPSLGDLSLLVISSFFIIYNFYLEVYFNPDKLNKSILARTSLYVFFGILVLILYFLQTFLVRSLILDSSIAFEAYKVLDLSIYTYLGFFLFSLVFASYTLIIDKIMGLSLKLESLKGLYVFLGAIIILAFAIFFIPESRIFIESPITLSVVIALLFYIRLVKRLKYRFSTFVIFIFLFSIYTVIEVVRLTEIKARGDMRILAVNLAAEHDPIAELLFVNISDQINNDIEIKELVLDPQIDIDELYQLIQQKYLSGYLAKYDMQVTLCQPDDEVYISPPEDEWLHCYSFFYEVIMSDAYRVTNSDFYFLSNMNGRISYFTAIPYTNNKIEITVFIELDSKLLSDGLGYPELLLENTLTSNSNNNYSYAKYFDGKLIAAEGSYSYRMTDDAYTSGSEGLEYLEMEGYDHVIYNIDSENTIITTKPSVMLIDTLITFSYIFVFFFFILIIILLLTGINPLIYTIEINFKNKIQFAMSGILFLSLLLIGSGTVYYSIMQYQNKHKENLKEKLQSLYVELIHKLEHEQDLSNWTSDSYNDLEKLLQKFSNVFYSDINLYDKNGRLLASSRPEIFEKGLAGRNMDAVAYMEMIYNKRSEFIHNEKIGGMRYLSAYVPFVNSENRLLAYLNLPYFTRQDELTAEISNLVVAIINIFVLLTLLTLTIAVFMANTITQPLRMIQERISLFNLNENNEKINYKGKDEVGSLVKEYNLMVEQLSDSAERLARSERESAWREMAKQIAHEIKNPLTPMRLIVQHFQRSLKDDENREEKMDKLSKILIEQIDNLSSIATEFSNFAKMPLARNEKLNISEVATDVLSLFSNTENIEFKINIPKKPVYVWADKEQLTRVFINLVKNAIQSISAGRNGLVELTVSTRNNKVFVYIRDNGKGIAEEIQEKLFQPNFTTKSGGMGMGLAISRNIINSAGGEITYQTEIGKGTVFIVELAILIE